jgi:hypothetical protein
MDCSQGIYKALSMSIAMMISEQCFNEDCNPRDSFDYVDYEKYTSEPEQKTRGRGISLEGLKESEVEFLLARQKSRRA